MAHITLDVDVEQGVECQFTITRIERLHEQFRNGELTFTCDVIEGEVFLSKEEEEEEEEVVHSGTRISVEISEGETAFISDAEQLSNVENQLEEAVFDAIFHACLSYGIGILIEDFKR